ncbi:NHLP bacteriocin export ABC transporter permease/ATPase subunit [Pleomorphomonas sp. JP5]|uniref:NHLP bacteriocin export ABC transporter permease/ATPase subunit n=1 Tax=Pleomorphomonas sp. JP5 TaxID=2942998 RepID=UPI002042E931|nr:NHLP bacteriocin export ABC transporter permease/ATPase subunit [Pleomorphomonas sp. JP5]MCM5558954.1 NHLP bacteriocin export ABC transporter permease/ATPase subunit [Pleomorphomonas sp. JP5]
MYQNAEAMKGGQPLAHVIEGGGNRPLALDGGFAAYRLLRGYADIFVVDRVGDRRRHLFRLEKGGMLFSTEAEAEGCLVAIGGLGSCFERVGLEVGLAKASSVGEWVRCMNGALGGSRDWPTRLIETEAIDLRPGETCSAAAGDFALVAADEPAFVWNGRVLEPASPFLIAAPGQLEAREEGRLRPVVDPGLQDMAEGLANLSRMMVGAVLAIFEAERTEANRRQDMRAASSTGRFSEALGTLAKVGDNWTPVLNPWHAAIEAAMKSLGRPSRILPDETRRKLSEARAFEPVLRDLLLDYREVVLKEGWWKRDGLPMLAETVEGEPLALVPARRGGFLAIGSDGQRRVDAAVAATLRQKALQLYPLLEDRRLAFRDLARFATRGMGAEAQIVVVTSILAALTMALLPVATGILFDTVAPLNDRSGLWQVALLLIAAAFGQSIFELTRAMTVERIEATLDARMQAAIVLRLFRLPASFFQRYAVGELGQRTLGLQEVRQLLTGSTLAGIFGLIGTVSGLATMAFINWRLTLFALAPILITVVVSGWIARRQLRHERARFERRGGSFLLQVLIGLPKLRAAAAEMRAFAEWTWRTVNERRELEQSRRWQGWQMVGVAVLGPLSLLFLFGCLLLVMKSETANAALEAMVMGSGAAGEAASLSTGMFVAFITAFGQVSAALTGTITAVSELLTIDPLVERTMPIVEAEPEISREREAPGRLSGEIAFNRVHFRYSPESPLVLRDVSFHIRPGEYIGIVGESGSGKSTIMRLLLGFETPEEGGLLFDGKPSDRLDPTLLRKEIGVVLQNGRITPGSIYENIAGASGLGLEAAWAAARLVALAPDVEAMPMGMHTVLSDGGGALSGGQRQRILLARSLVSEPKILLLDEATSALDNRTQQVVTDTLARLQVTRIVIAHRLSTIREVDRILVMDKGRLVESGTYDQLIEAGGLFHALARRQLLENEA